MTAFVEIKVIYSPLTWFLNGVNIFFDNSWGLSCCSLTLYNDLYRVVHGKTLCQWCLAIRVPSPAVCMSKSFEV